MKGLNETVQQKVIEYMIKNHPLLWDEFKDQISFPAQGGEVLVPKAERGEEFRRLINDAYEKIRGENSNS